MADQHEASILVVNDAPDQLDVMSALLRATGYRVHTANNGGAGFAAALDQRPDLVISDVAMPGVDGIQLCRRVRADGHLKETPILLVSAVRVDDPSAVEGLEAGADYYMEAPYDSFRLVAQVARLIERKRSADALRRSEHKYRMLMEESSDAVVIAEDGGKITEVNHRASELLGYSHEELLGMSLGDLTPGAGWAGRARLRENGSALYEDSLRRKDQTAVPVEVGVTVLEGRRTQAVIRDITHRKRAEEMLRSLNEELERRVAERTARLQELNEDLESFSYSVSHDLRAPLKFIGCLVRQVREKADPVLDETGAQNLKIIAESIAGAVKMIDALLSVSRAGCRPMCFGAVDMDFIVAEVRRRLACESGGVTWKLGPLGGAWGDGVMLDAVWQNLLSNAIKFTRNRDEPVIEAGSFDRGGESVFYVRDNGVGFDMGCAGRLFGAFQRLHDEREFEGMGVGLANALRIVRRHSGRMWAEGAVDGGATFYFSLPRPGEGST